MPSELSRLPRTTCLVPRAFKLMPSLEDTREVLGRVKHKVGHPVPGVPKGCPLDDLWHPDPHVL